MRQRDRGIFASQIGSEDTDAGGSSAPLRVLLVEDERSDAELISATLESAGYELNLDVVDDIAEYRRRLQTTPYDVVIADHSLPSWTGMDALSLLRTSGKDIPFITVTATLGDQAAVEYMKQGATDYVLKNHLSRLPLAVGRAVREWTHRKESERLREQISYGKREWELTFDAVPDPVLVIGPDGRIQRANAAAARLFGLTFQQMIGAPCHEVVHGRTDPLPSCPHQCLLSTGQTAQGDIEEPRLGRVFHSTTTPLMDHGGSLRGCVHVLRDITDRKRTEETLRRQALIFENMSDAVVIADGDFKIIDWNPAAERTFGFAKYEVLGRHVSILYQPADADRQLATAFARRIRSIINSGGTWSGEFEVSHKDGSRSIVETVIVPLRDERGVQIGFVGVNRDMTERKRTEEALRRQALIFENMYDAVVIADGDFKIIDWNPAAERTFGFAKNEVLGRHVSILHRPEDADRQLASIRSVLEAGGRWSGEFELSHKDGTRNTVETVIVPLRDERGVKIGSVGVNRDMTERKRAERALRESEERYRILLLSTAEAIYGVDMEGNCTFCNPATLRVLGYQHAEELLGRNMHDLVHHTRPDGSSCPKSECEIYRALREWRGTHRDDEVLWRSDNTSFAAEYWSYPVEKDGERIGAVVTFLDISERKRAEKALHESEEKYREVVENATYAIFRSKPDGTVLDVNPAFVKMLGYDSKEEVLALNLNRDIYENQQEREAILQRYQIAVDRISAEANFRRRDGSLIRTKMNGRPVWDANGNLAHFEVIAEDVTEQRRIEEQFRQAQKMEAMGRLAGGIAHDLNNILMVVSSYAEMILGREALDPKVERYTGNIMNAGRRATSLINQLLAFSRKQMLQPTTLELAAVVGEMDEMLSRILGEDVQKSLVIEPGLGKVYADRTQIEQVLMNLVVNARDAMPRGGRLRIELKNMTVDADYVLTHRDVKAGEYVMLAVSDSGMGMDSATTARIFEPFFTTKPVGKGTGLGLATVYGIVKQSGGFIWVYSEPDLGTTFRVYLPRVHGRTTPTASPADNAASLVGKGECVLLVDDDSDLRSAAREFLQAKGYRVLEAANGFDALEVCRSSDCAVQALVTDLIMPGMRGVELAAKVSALHPQVKVIYMSGYADRFEDVAERGPGATFLQKPFSLNILANTLHSLFHGGATSAPAGDGARETRND